MKLTNSAAIQFVTTLASVATITIDLIYFIKLPNDVVRTIIIYFIKLPNGWFSRDPVPPLCFSFPGDPLRHKMNVMDAVTGFLRKVRELDTYGIRLYNVRFEEGGCELGISPGGVAIFRREKRIVFHDWTSVAEVSFKNKKFFIMVAGTTVSCWCGWVWFWVGCVR